LNSDGATLYMKIVAFNEIYNFVVQISSIWSHLRSLIIDKLSRSPSSRQRQSPASVSRGSRRSPRRASPPSQRPSSPAPAGGPSSGGSPLPRRFCEPLARGSTRRRSAWRRSSRGGQIQRGARCQPLPCDSSSARGVSLPTPAPQRSSRRQGAGVERGRWRLGAGPPPGQWCTNPAPGGAAGRRWRLLLLEHRRRSRAAASTVEQEGRRPGRSVL
jgi:hypothetical protein